MPIPAAILTLGLSVVLVLIGLWVGQNVNLLPIDASANAPVYDELFQVLFSIGTSLLLGIVGLLIYSLIRYRRVAGDTGDGLAIEGNLPLEVFWPAVPALVVLFIGIYARRDGHGGGRQLSQSGPELGWHQPHGSWDRCGVSRCHRHAICLYFSLSR